jgi:hypothetical protein
MRKLKLNLLLVQGHTAWLEPWQLSLGLFEAKSAPFCLSHNFYKDSLSVAALK